MASKKTTSKRAPAPKKAPAKKKAAPKPPPVLGNDPFARGAANRPVAETTPQAPPPREPSLPNPELQVKQAVAPARRPVLQKLDTRPKGGLPEKKAPPAPPKPPPSAPVVRPTPRRGSPVVQPISRRTPELQQAPLSSPPIRPGKPHAASPSVGVDPIPHAAAPAASELKGPTAHAASPSATFVPVAHANAPAASEIKGPTAHSASPSVTFEPVAHASAPAAAELTGPTAHAASPSATFVPVAHAAAPAASELKGPTAHAASPSVTFEPVAHASAPAASELKGPTAHAASPSATFVPVAHASAPAASELKGPTAHAASPSASFVPVAHASAPAAAELNGPTAHSASPSATFVPVAHANAPAAAELNGPTAHSASPSATFEPVEHAEAPEERSPAALGRPQDASVAPATLLGALKGIAGAVRSSIGLSSRAAQTDDWGKDHQLATSLRPLGELLYEKYWRVRVEGAEHLPDGPFIIVANHAGALPLDGPVLHLALRKERPDLPEARWLLEDQIFHAPFVGVLANRLGAVRASPENANRLLSEGRPLIVFPEGFHGLSKPFSERYQLRRFGRGGYVKIALRAGVPVVPAAIVGGEESMPLLGKLPGGFLGVEYLPLTLPPLPARWHIRFAEPVSLDGAPNEPEHDLAWVERKNLAVRDQIEGMLTDLLKHRDAVF